MQINSKNRWISWIHIFLLALFLANYLKIIKENLINDEILTEDFTIDIVPDESLFVLGDNRQVSKDSRIFGFIPMNSVIGKGEFRFYPLKDLGNI